MTNKMFWLGCAGAALIGGPAEAQTPGGFEIGAQLFDYRYRERHEAETVARDKGTFKGFRLGYVETIGGDSFLRARFETSLAKIDYSSDEGATRIEDVPQSAGQFELHFGKDFAMGGGAVLTPFIGIGARVLIDESGGRTSNNGLEGYDREVSYGYVPIGVAAGFSLAKPTRLRLSAQYNWLVSGESQSKFSTLDPELPDVTVAFESGHGIEASAMLSARVSGGEFSMGPFLRSWRIDRSESFVIRDPEAAGDSIEFFEPRSRTVEAGVRVSFNF